MQLFHKICYVTTELIVLRNMEKLLAICSRSCGAELSYVGEVECGGCQVSVEKREAFLTPH